MKEAERSSMEKRSAENDRWSRYSNSVSLCALRKAFVCSLSFIYLYIDVPIYFSGEPFYSSARSSKEPRLQAHPDYGATEIRN